MYPELDAKGAFAGRYLLSRTSINEEEKLYIKVDGRKYGPLLTDLTKPNMRKSFNLFYHTLYN